VHVVVGTPGRVYDMLCRRALRPDDYIKAFVLDEPDTVLHLGQLSTAHLSARIC